MLHLICHVLIFIISLGFSNPMPKKTQADAEVETYSRQVVKIAENYIEHISFRKKLKRLTLFMQGSKKNKKTSSMCHTRNNRVCRKPIET